MHVYSCPFIFQAQVVAIGEILGEIAHQASFAKEPFWRWVKSGDLGDGKRRSHKPEHGARPLIFAFFFCFSDFFLSESHGWHELTVWNYIVWPVCRLWSVLPPANENISTVISTWPHYAVNVGKAAKSSLQSVLAIALSGHFLACQQLLSSVSLISCTASFSSSEWLHKLKHVETKAIHDFDYFVFSEQDIELQFQSSSENWWSPSLLLVSKGLHLPFPFFFVDVCPSITALPKLAKKCKE